MSIISPYLRTCAVCGLFDPHAPLLVRKRIIVYNTMRVGEPLCDECFEWYHNHCYGEGLVAKPMRQHRAFWNFRFP